MESIVSFRFSRVSVLVVAMLAFAACATPRSAHRPADASPQYKIGEPYKVNGRWYRPEADPNYEAVGVASWYGDDFHGRLTANGEIFDMNRLSAAHKTLPMPSLVEVTNLENGRHVVVRVNDRGPFARDRLIDLSREAARRLGFEKRGTARVRVRFVGLAPLAAKAPKGPQRVARAAPEPEEPPSREASAILAAMVQTPSLAPGVDAANFAEAKEPVQEPTLASATQIGSGHPVGETKMVDLTPSNSGVEALYVIRIAALSRLDNIGRLKSQLEPIGPLRLSRIETGDGSVLYRVNMGPYASLETAHQRLEAVRGAGYNDAGLVTLTP